MKFVYMLRSGERDYKVGVASNVLSRVKGIQTGNQHRIVVVATKPVDDFARAARLLDCLEENKIVEPAHGARPRELVTN